MAEQTKICTKCDVEKPLAEFVKDARLKDGHRGYCKICGNKYNIERRKLLRDLPTPYHVHGTLRGYADWGCRCDKCHEAHRVVNMVTRGKMATRGCPPEKHGTLTGYTAFKCRCKLCKAAMKLYQQDHRAKRDLNRAS